ncbi:PREDICTED: Nance-Horan syndrome protein-like isoform X1 [Poecilia mexicana]|uniref:Nance-Horan syndrome a (congenital cataracts and dental anomalies) n=2 Tax=Poecilia mexicana TaxID=48701 RepID=A0A3B3YTF1_9TELE|nr:PREDICTED: Nance-Horan syndrome protein-like isoform X1 [Poecilia mexicana]
MPFAKRAVKPQLLCRYRSPSEVVEQQQEEGLLFEDLVSISNVALSRTLRQLSDLAKHACSIFQELENDLASTNQRVRGLQGKITQLQQCCSELDPRQEAVPVSDLDVESKLTAHFRAPWRLQRNVLHPSTRPACVEELYMQANHSLWSLNQDHQRRERRVTISALPPMPISPSPLIEPTEDGRGKSLTTFDSTRSSSPTECCSLSPWSRKAAPTDPDTDGVALGHRSKFPIPNIPSTLDKQTNWSRALPLPTPEERMKCNSQVIASCIIPINVTGVGFDRDASVRCSLVHSQSLLQRRRKLRRRRTVAGFPRQVQQDFDSDDSPGSRERTVIVHTTANITPSTEELASHLTTRDSGCQTEDFLTSGAPSRRRLRVQRGQGVSLLLSHSAGNISCLPDSADPMFSSSVEARLRSRSLPRDSSRMMMILMDDERNDSDDEEELAPFDSKGFLPGRRERILKEEEESADDRAMSERQMGGLKFPQLSESPECSWMERTGAQLPRKADMGSCEISSSSDTFSSPVHSVSAAGVLGSQMDHKDDHQSSSGNWSGSSSTCPSQTSETIPPAASPPLTGSSHCDSELSLNATTHTAEDQTSFLLDNYQGLRTQRAGSFSSAAMDILEEVGVSTPVEGEWDFPNAEPSSSQGFSPEPGREAESSLGCPSFTSMATCESSFSDKPPSEKADTVSYYSVDTEGYYTSMHFDCGLKGSKSFTYNYATSGSDCGLSDTSGQLTLGRRCLSLRKSKAKPSPPKRSSSLRKICSEGHIPENREPKITGTYRHPASLSSKERRMQLALSGSQGLLENSSLGREPLEVWAMEGMSDLTDLGVLSSKDAHSFKDNGIVQSDYADLWLLNDLKSSDPYRSLSNSSTATGTTVIECIKSQESSESQTSQSGSRATTPSLPSVESEFKLTSPEKLAGLASPSSGYSSQSETPTSSFPSTFFPGPLSPATGKRKPKVPERKSSLSSLSLQARSSRDVATSKKDLELPMIPPSHLDLSALHSPSNKGSAYGNQLPKFLQIKQKDVPTAKAVTSPNLESFTAHSLSITPSILQKVQLRSINKQPEDLHKNKVASRLQCPSDNSTNSQLLDLKSSSLHNSHNHHVSSNNSIHASNEELSMANSKGTEVLSGRVTAVGLRSEPCLDGSNVPKTLTINEAEHRSESPVTSICSRESIPHVDASCQQQTELPEAEMCPCPPVLHSSPKRSNCVDKVPAADSPLETSQESSISSEGENDTSGVSAESASQDRKEESAEEADDCFSKDYTESDNSALSQLEESKKEDDSVFLSPTKSRTTEDLFAMIHRSKRKVLGRKDSTELAARTRLSASSGNTPPPGSSVSSPVPAASPSSSPAVTPPAPHRASGPIYRNAKKSSTSNEEFKQLLLKKGSRSDSSYRMSAAEILKSPVTPKSPGDFLTESPRQSEEAPSPLQQLLLDQEQLSSPYPKANAESFSPRPFLASAASRQGRSRIPPPASSSRYSVRSRLYSTPMQAISEGEAENSDGSPHDDRST